jgi:hypothetical protein
MVKLPLKRLAVTANLVRNRRNTQALLLQIVDQNDLSQCFYLATPVYSSVLNASPLT